MGGEGSGLQPMGRDSNRVKGNFMAKAKETWAKNASENDELLTLSEVAEIFNVHRNTVSNWIAAKALPFIRTPGGMPKVRRSHVAAIIGIASSTI